MNSVDEDFCDSTKQLSGYFKITGSKSKNYFYWFFDSILALLQENGPCSVNDDLSLKKNPYSWTERANVMWIDQPVGEFFQAKPEYQKLPFYVFGESYAGHYVPASRTGSLLATSRRKDLWKLI
ncbi:Alpha/Beta hydrolase fold [Phytophthora cactorum]|nr:Alpha/Beta hydrolase fold [Phytophthora cactorum]